METPLHPALVHLPLGLAVALPLVAAAVTLAIWRGWLPRRGWLLVVAMSALLLGGAGVALVSGERDEERAEAVVPEPAIEAHEAAGKRFTAVAGATVLLAALVLAGRKQGLQRGLMVATTAAAVALLGAGLSVGKAGGELVYRDGAASAWTGATAVAAAEAANPATAEPAPDDEEDTDDDD